jgi:hypothetical protein
MSHTDFDGILDECLARMAAGESVDACLRRYPQHAAGLQPLLRVAAGLHALPRPEPGADAVLAGRQRMLAALREQKRARGVSISPLSRYARQIRDFFVPQEGVQMRHVLRFAVAMVLVMFVGTNLAVVASAGSIPGDPLYGVKRSWEEARLLLALRDQTRQQLEQQLLDRRQEEVRELLSMGRGGVVDLEGVLQQHGEDQWSIGGLVFRQTARTRVEGDLTPGARVRVRVQVLNDGTLVALQMRTRTRPLPLPTPGPSQTPDDKPGPFRTPAASGEPTQPAAGPGQPTPVATRTPRATSTPGPAETPRPTGTHCPQCTPEPPARTAEPQRTGEPQRTSAPTGEPQHTPEPTGEPQHTPEPTGEPQRTAEPQHTPEPTGEPQRTAEPQHTPDPTGEPQHTPDPSGEPKRTPESGGGPGATPGS